MAHPIQRTGNHKEVIVARLIAGGPLVVFAPMHLIGVSPIGPLLEAAGIPLAGVAGILIPIVQVIAGLSLLLGLFARVGGVLAAVAMLGALYVHFSVSGEQWEQIMGAAEFPLVVPLVVLLCGLYVAWRGGGAWSLDLRQTQAGPAAA